MTAWRTVCSEHDIPAGEARMFVLDDELIVAVFHIDGEFYALDNACPHAGASLAHGIVENDEVRCRIHHWRFAVRDGRYLDEDKPACNVRSFPVRREQGQLQIDVEPTP